MNKQDLITLLQTPQNVVCLDKKVDLRFINYLDGRESIPQFSPNYDKGKIVDGEFHRLEHWKNKFVSYEDAILKHFENSILVYEFNSIGNGLYHKTLPIMNSEEFVNKIRYDYMKSNSNTLITQVVKDENEKLAKFFAKM
ncbi:Uncharacterised protein [Candidatus Tiddalikarchaeum anstoanum]|nr:Uncharacterised protein [Candidatus Tiddalikarchaeum anstoanum]